MTSSQSLYTTNRLREWVPALSRFHYTMLTRVARNLLSLRYNLCYSKMASVVGIRKLSTSGVQISDLCPTIQQFINEKVALCQPDKVYVCDGSDEENKAFIQQLLEDGRFVRLTKYDNCYHAHTIQVDTARVEKQTFVCTEKKSDAVPSPKPGVVSKLGNWKSPKEMDAELNEKFKGCMKGRTMYVIPYSMGPIDSPLSKIGIQLTDSEYVVVHMRIMTRIGKKVLDTLGSHGFVKCVHSVGYPLEPGQDDVPWPCNPEKLAVVHFPERNKIKSFGSGYGGNSLLGKKCFALRIASTLARREGWLAEHMLILGLTNPEGRKRYIAAAFPSACGKTNLAMITPTIPGWKAECVGDDIAWMKFDETGQLRAINPENGFFGVAPGTSFKSNPNAMKSIFHNTIFTNTAKTSDGGVWWEGMEPVEPGVKITSWLGAENWQDLPPEKKKEKTASHPNARFCSPTAQYPCLDKDWESPKGVPIDAIFFGGRRPTTIPLIYESFNWTHGVFVGSCMKSESTAAALDVKKKTVVHDPFAMRPFFGYNFVQYLEHWLELQERPNVKLPKIFHVNWFKMNDKGEFVWPGFGENLRVIDWALRRCDGEDIADECPLGYIPKPGTINLDGLSDSEVDKDLLFKLDKAELEADIAETETYFNEQLPDQLPAVLQQELEKHKERIAKM